MRDEDEIALVRYDDRSELIQPLSRVGNVRSSLAARVNAIEAGGGTNIPGGLSHGLRTLDEAVDGARRIASDYPAHSQAARHIAEEYFDARRVLARFLDDVDSAAV
jgi:hypothetical protein